jgi:hypothetical protein
VRPARRPDGSVAVPPDAVEVRVLFDVGYTFDTDRPAGQLRPLRAASAA